MSDWDDAFSEVQVIRGLDFDKYLAIDAVSNSRMKLLDRSPKHYQANPSTGATRSLSVGTMVHTAVLEPSTYPDRYVCPPAGLRMDKRTKAYQEFLATVPNGAEVVSFNDMAEAWHIADDIRGDESLDRFFTQDCESELTVLWTDPATGLRCKIRIDKFCPGVGFLDLKTTRDCSVAQFPWAARRYGYFQQTAFYRRGIIAAQAAGKLPSTGQDVPAYILAVETGPVRAHALYAVPDAEMTHFDQVVSERLDLIASCTAANVWPGPGGESGAPIPLTYPGRLEFDENEEAADAVAEDWGE